MSLKLSRQVSWAKAMHKNWSRQWRKTGWGGFQASGETTAPSTEAQSPAARTGTREEVSPVAEERLRVGKREVNRGGVRVRSYDNLMQERTVEMSETAEEPVVQKDTRVKEEVVVRKRADERVEQVQDTVWRTEVDIEKDSDTDKVAPRGPKGRPEPRHRPRH